MPAPNRNILWAEIFVDELARSGLEAVCIAPGSRSTPLTLAFANHPSIQVYSHLDERSGSFFALGMAKASEKPVALVCTSGTATANFLPAIIEAKQYEVSLLVLTSDRPHELRHSGANQTIDQVKIYGDQVLWAYDLPLPEANPPDVAIRNLRTVACRAYAMASGSPKGPVHLNFPFRKPLEPTPVDEDVTTLSAQASARANGQPFTRFSLGIRQPEEQQIQILANAINQYEKGLIICGGGCPGGDFPQAVAELSRISGYPILAEPLSGVRYQPYQSEATIIGGYDYFLGMDVFQNMQLDVVIRFGKVPTSKAINAYLNQSQMKIYAQMSESGIWSDDSHLTSMFIHGDGFEVCRQLCVETEPRISSQWLIRFREAEITCWEIFDEAIQNDFYDGRVIHDIIENLPDGASIYVANSLPIRQVEQFGKPSEKHIQVFGNRGASGIDGTISSALGAAKVSTYPTVLITGDLSLYHDMNGLLAVQRCEIPLTIVLINNNGGGIFHRLPISQFDPPFTELFITPHGLDFQHAANLYGLHYTRPTNAQEFNTTFREALRHGKATLIEIQTNALEDEQYRQILMKKIQTEIRRQLQM